MSIPLQRFFLKNRRLIFECAMRNAQFLNAQFEMRNAQLMSRVTVQLKKVRLRTVGKHKRSKELILNIYILAVCL